MAVYTLCVHLCYCQLSLKRAIVGAVLKMRTQLSRSSSFSFHKYTQSTFNTVGWSRFRLPQPSPPTYFFGRSSSQFCRWRINYSEASSPLEHCYWKKTLFMSGSDRKVGKMVLCWEGRQLDTMDWLGKSAQGMLASVTVPLPLWWLLSLCWKICHMWTCETV